MSVVIIPRSVVLSGAMPNEIQGPVDPNVWAQLLAGLRQAGDTANCIACGGEVACCLIFGFPCIFCCHPCIADALTSSQNRDACTRINHSFYQGRPVFGAGENLSIVVSLGQIGGSAAQIIQQPMAYAQPAQAYSPQPAYPAVQAYAAEPEIMPAQAKADLYQPQAPQYQQAAPVYQQPPQYQQPASAYQQPGTPHTPTPSASPVTLQVTVPAGVGPGSVLQVQAPDGRTVQITVPPNVQPGTTLQVQV